MKHLYFLILSLIFIQFNAKAQRNFKPGYIVTLKGDTTKGFVDYKQWGQRSPTLVNFKDALNTAVTKYEATDISAFGIYGYENYRALTVSLSQNTIAVDDLVNFVDTTVVKKTIFLRLVVDGKKVSFFVYDDSFKQRCYVAEGNSLPYELKVYRHTSNIDATKIIEVNTYTQQLQRLASLYKSGSAALINSIQRSLYNEQDFKKIIVAINGDGDLIKYIEPERAVAVYFIGLGFNANKIEFTGTHYYASSAPSLSYMPQLNTGVDVFLNKNVGKTIFRAELNISASKAQFHYEAQDFNQNLGGAYTYGSNFKMSRISVMINPQLLHNFYNGGDFRAFIAGGAAIEFSTYSTIQEEDFTVVKGVTKFINRDPHNLSKSQFTLTAKAGINIVNKFQFYAGYIMPTKIFDGGTYSLKVNTLRFGVNYRIGQNSNNH